MLMPWLGTNDQRPYIKDKIHSGRLSLFTYTTSSLMIYRDKQNTLKSPIRLTSLALML